MLKKLCCSSGDKDEPGGSSQPTRVVETPKATNTKPKSEIPLPVQAEKGETKGLWEKAFDTLGDDSKRWLSAKKDVSALEAVIAMTREKHSEYKEGSLKIRKLNGGDISVYDSGRKIIESALAFKDVVTAVVAFDPTGHASTVWGVVSIGLTLVHNDILRRDAILEASEYLSDRLAQYAMIEKHFWQIKQETDRKIEDALVAVYTAILNYAAEVNRAKQENAAAHVARSIKALTGNPFERLKSSVQGKDTVLNQWRTLAVDLTIIQNAEAILAASEGNKKLLEDSYEINVEIRDAVFEIHEKAISSEDRDILEWLSTSDYSRAQNNAFERRQGESGKWFLQLPKYQSWRDKPGSIFWLNGVAGCGKSILCSTIVKNLQILRQRKSMIKVVYWYFQFSVVDSQRPANMIRSLLRQLTKENIPPHVRNLWQTHRQAGSFPDYQTLVESLNKVISDYTGEVYLVLDALDECPERPVDGRRRLLDTLLKLIERNPTKLHIVATSRPEPDINDKLKACLVEDLEPGLRKDVDAFVRARIHDGKLRKKKEPIRQLIIDTLLTKQERRFRWADLQITRLENECDDDEDVRQALRTIPDSLEANYRMVLDRLKTDKRKSIARLILIWLSFSCEPLTVDTIAKAASLSDADRVLDICTTTLVTLDTSNRKIRLAHFSVKEFLAAPENAELEWYHFSPLTGHRILAEQTLECVLGTDIENSAEETVLDPLSFEAYAALFWHEHVQQLGDSINNYITLQDSINCLFSNEYSRSYVNWVCITNKYHGFPWHLMLEECEPPLYHASRLGIYFAAERMLQNGAGPSAWKISSEEDSFTIAAKEGHLDILKILLTKCPMITQDRAVIIIRWIRDSGPGRERLSVILDILWNMGVLFDKAEMLTIDISIITATASNWKHSVDIMAYFLHHRPKAVRHIPSSVFEDSKHSPSFLRLIKFLLDAAELQIVSINTTDLSELQYAKGALDVIIPHRVTDPMLFEELSFRDIACSCCAESVRLVLDVRGADTSVTDEVLSFSAMFTQDPEVIRVLFQHRSQYIVTIHDEIFRFAATNRSVGVDIMSFLLDRCEPGRTFDEKLCVAVLSNVTQGLQIMKMLLLTQRVTWVASQSLLSRAVQFDHGRDMLELLVNNSASEVVFTEEIIHRVAVCSERESVWQYFLDLKGSSLPMSPSMLESAIEHRNIRAIEMIFDQYPESCVTDQMWKLASNRQDVLTVLLDRHNGPVPVPLILKAATPYSFTDARLAIGMLMDRQLLDVNAELVEMIAHNESSMLSLMSRIRNIPITEKVLIEVAHNAEMMRILLNSRAKDIIITEAIMINAAANLAAIKAIHLRYQGELPVTENALVRAVLLGNHTEEKLDFLLSLRDKNIPITEKMAYAAANNRTSAIEAVFRRQGDIPITERMLSAAACSLLGQDAVGYLLEKGCNVHLQPVWEAMWRSYPMGRIRVTHTLMKYSSLQISEEVLDSVETWEGGDTDDLFRFCVKNDIRIIITARLVEIVVEKVSLKTLKVFLLHNCGIQLTQKLIEIVSDSVYSEEKLSLLNTYCTPLCDGDRNGPGKDDKIEDDNNGVVGLAN